MGDIAFLLIIFFIITSVFVKDIDKQLELPQSADIEKFEKKLPPVQVIIDKDRRVWVLGRGMPGDQPIAQDVSTAQESAVQDAVAQALQNSFGEAVEDYEIVFKVDKKITYKDYNKILNAATAGGGGSMALSGDQVDTPVTGP
jgi:biopolymer transport protein ExbD